MDVSIRTTCIRLFESVRSAEDVSGAKTMFSSGVVHLNVAAEPHVTVQPCRNSVQTTDGFGLSGAAWM